MKEFLEQVAEFTKDMKSCTFVFSMDGELMNITVLAKYDTKEVSLQTLPPVVIRDTIDEISENIFTGLKEQLIEGNAKINTVKDFEKNIEAGIKKTDMAKKEADKKKLEKETEKKKLESAETKITKIVEALKTDLDIPTTNEKQLAAADKKLGSIKVLNPNSKQIKTVEDLIKVAKSKLGVQKLDFFADGDEF